MALPDRTLCWVEGPPWDRTCEPVEGQPAQDGESRSRWEAFSDEEIAELDSLIAAAEESYGVSDDALRLSAEVKAERDHRETRLP